MVFVHAVEVTTDLDALVRGVLALVFPLSQHSVKLDCGWDAVFMN